MSVDYEIKHSIIPIVEEHGDSTFRHLMTLARQATWKWKPEVKILKPQFSTTLGNCVYVSKSDWLAAGLIDRSKLVVHESTHLAQWHHGGLWFATRYMQKSGRFELELAAFKNEVKWACINNVIVNPMSHSDPMVYIRSVPMVERFWYNLTHSYFMNDYARSKESTFFNAVLVTACENSQR